MTQVRAELERDAERLRAVHAAVTALDPRGLERAEHAGRLAAEIVAPLRAALAEAIELVARLEQACDLGEPETGEWGDHLEHTGVQAAIEPDGPDSVASALSGELWQQVGNLAFAARSELRRAERRLAAPEGDHDARVTACESARRKLRRALHAVLEATAAALGRDLAVGGVDVEVEAALSVRRMFAKFRRSLPPCDPADPAQVRRALRFAAVSLAVMVGSPDFGELRAPDRQLLLQLQARILAWARAGGSEAEGSRLYQDLQTAADLLRTINQRQELVAHDRAALGQLAQVLASAQPARERLTAALALLRGLAGRDDDLDSLVATIADGDAPEPTLARVRARLTAVGLHAVAA